MENTQIKLKKFSEFVDLPIIDCHLHLWMASGILTDKTLRRQGEKLVEIIRKGGINQIYTTDGDVGIHLKARYPQLFYAGGPITEFQRESIDKKKLDWKTYIRNLINVGFDGIGEMGSKPRPKEKRISLDNPRYESFWSACETFDYTVLCHVADPEEFWDEKLLPNWAKTRGWGYYKGDFPSKEELYIEMTNVLDRYPDLKIVLCHFYFMSADLERASDFFDHYKNAHFDLSLGVELMHNISRCRDDWRNFFIKYNDKILYGTDIGVSRNLQQHLSRIWLIRNFLESDEEFYTPPTADNLLTRYKEPYIGLKLPRTVLEKIYFKNFQRLWSKKPKKINLNAAIARCEREGNKVVANSLRNLI